MNRLVKLPLLALTAALAGYTLPARAQDFTIVNAKLAIGDGSEPIDNGVVEIRGGKVVSAGPAAGSATRTGTVLDAEGAWVTPGIFAAITDIGLVDVGGVDESNDTRASDSPFNIALDVSTSINPAAQDIGVSRAGGVTRASITPSPGDSIFAGQGAIIDLGADPNAVTMPRAFQMVILGEGGARLAGGSRVATNVALRNALREASEFASGTWEGEAALLTRADVAALVPVIRGEQKLYIYVERAADIRAVLAMRSEFPKLDMVLIGASEGWMVADALAAANVPVIAEALDDLPAKFEQLAATQSNVGRMVAAGVKVAIGGMTGTEQPRNATQYAGNLVALSRVPRAAGLTWGQALAAITSVPASISGMDGKLGSLTAGAAGDVVIWDGDPLELSSAPLRVFIDGVEQPVDNHQTRLRERYRDLDESDLPKAYDW
ncbi:amidohydrolase family protein [Allopontixanthobacter sediminis]|uniref:Amidohydrolase family protein n=1 Tax=Allopontixanthobacter sediminis TaxID=1689985 RepID=A0A845BAN5_9SPHN|nr:amidohydrolase family protein [Allopontixanthobacter sediminis]MXP44649.1 amidohydrolase family protein [Allopontixanthobacter sediminis]